MPLIMVTMIEGRSAQAKRDLIKGLTDVAVSTLDAPAASVRVIVQEVPAENWGVAGVPKGPGKTPDSPSA